MHSRRSSRSSAIAAGKLLAVVRGVDRRVASMTRGALRTPRTFTRQLYERLQAPLNLARFGEALLPSSGSTWPEFVSDHEVPPVTWVGMHRPDWLLNLSVRLHLEFHDAGRMQPLIRGYSESFATAPDVSPVDLIRRATLGETVAQVRVTHAFFDHLARAVLYLRGPATSSFSPRIMSKEHNVLTGLPIYLAALTDAERFAKRSEKSHFFLAPSLDNGTLDQADEAAALEWLFRRERMYKYLQLQLLEEIFGEFKRSYALIGSTKRTMSEKGHLTEMHAALKDVDVYVVCSEKLISGVLRLPFSDRIRAVTALPTAKPLAGFQNGDREAFATEIVERAQQVQRDRPLVILSQCGLMNAVIAAKLLESLMSHVALIDIGRALEILVGGRNASAGIYTRSTGHVGKFTYLVPVSPEKWRARRERIQM